jgi:hypothetical protein
VLTLPLPQAKAVLAHQLALDGQGYLAWRYPGFPVPPLEQLEALASDGLDAAMYVCAPDLMEEIEATTGWVNGRMSSGAVFP